LPEPRVAYAAVLSMYGDMAEAVAQCRIALSRAPGNAEAHAMLGRFLAEAGMLDEAARRMEAALAIDPAVPLTASSLARTYAMMGDWKRADAATERGVTEGLFATFTNQLRWT